MTTEERVRMNEICASIQEETDYHKFAALLDEMSELIRRKEERRFRDYPKLIWRHDRPWKTISAVVKKILPTGVVRNPEKVEITINEADYLFREVRLENTLTDPTGGTVALKQGARLDVTLEANVADTVNRSAPTA